MAVVRITAFRIEIAPNGGFVSGQTSDGRSFDLRKLQYPEAAAIATVVNGPNAGYDHENRVFVCSLQKPPLTTPLISGGIEGIAQSDLSF